MSPALEELQTLRLWDLKRNFRVLCQLKCFLAGFSACGGCEGGGGGGGDLQYLSSETRFIVWAEFLSAALLQKKKKKIHQSLAFSDPQWSNFHPSHLGDVLYRTFARKSPSGRVGARSSSSPKRSRLLKFINWESLRSGSVCPPSGLPGRSLVSECSAARLLSP